MVRSAVERLVQSGKESGASGVRDLQRRAAEDDGRLSDLLRMALVVATRLKLEEFRDWVVSELNGYLNVKAIPEYRELSVQLKAWNPFRGWIPVEFEDQQLAGLLSKVKLNSPVSQIEETLAKADPKITLSIRLAPGVLDDLRKLSDSDLEPVQVVQRTQLASILSAVRNRVLETALSLEQKGILGEGIMIPEKKGEPMATQPAVQITNFHGVLGDIHGGEIQIGDYNSIRKTLKDLGVSSNEREKLEEIMDELEEAKAEDRKTLLRRGAEWVGRNIETLGKFAEVLSKFFRPTPLPHP